MSHVEVIISCEHYQNVLIEIDADTVEEIMDHYNWSVNSDYDLGCDCGYEDTTHFNITFFHDGRERDVSNKPDTNELNLVLSHNHGSEIVCMESDFMAAVSWLKHGTSYESDEAYAQSQYDVDHILFHAINWGHVFHQLSSGMSHIELEDGTIYVK